VDDWLAGSLRCRPVGQVAVDAPAEDFGNAFSGVEFALAGDGGEEAGGWPSCGLGVVEAADEGAPGGVGDEGLAVVVAEDLDGGVAVSGLGELVGGVEVARDEGGEGSGLFLAAADGAGGGVLGAFGGQDGVQDLAGGVAAGVVLDAVGVSWVVT